MNKLCNYCYHILDKQPTYNKCLNCGDISYQDSYIEAPNKPLNTKTRIEDNYTTPIEQKPYKPNTKFGKRISNSIQVNNTKKQSI